MKLSFPNPSRSFDVYKNRIRFWGHDSAIEILFFVEESALKKLCPEMCDTEMGFLKAFDSARNQILKVANKVYIKGGKGKGSYTYTLVADDF